MSRLLVIGTGPLADEDVRYLDARGLRTWQIARPLVEDGHTLRLVTIPPHEAENQACELIARKYGDLAYEAFTRPDEDFIFHRLAQLADEFQPDALIAVGSLPASLAARLPVRKPLWADLHRYTLASCQALSARRGDDGILREAWRHESIALRRADKCSAASRPQLYAMLGEMGRLGRFNSQTAACQFIHLMPDAFHPAFARPLAPDTRPVVRGIGLPGDAFIVLWSGGYNYWTDPDFLFECLERAMDAAPEIHFVSTGGAIPGFNDTTYHRFQDLVEISSHRDHYHLLGWLPFERVRALHAEADLGLCIDTPNYETFFGARNRLNNMLAAGLPVLTTWGTEIAALIDETHCGIVVPPDDTAAVVRGLLNMVRAPEQCRKLSAYARQVALEEFDAVALSAPLRHWAQAPSFAPENAAKLRLDPQVQSVGTLVLNPLDRLALIGETSDLADIEADYEELKALQSKLWFKAAVALRRSGQGIRSVGRKILKR